MPEIRLESGELLLPVPVRFSVESTFVERIAMIPTEEVEPTRRIIGFVEPPNIVDLVPVSPDFPNPERPSLVRFALDGDDADSWFTFNDNGRTINLTFHIGAFRFARVWNELMGRPSSRLDFDVDLVAYSENGDLPRDKDDVVRFYFPVEEMWFAYVAISGVQIKVADKWGFIPAREEAAP